MPRPDPTVLDDLAAMPDYVADRLGALDAEDARRPGPDASLSPVEQCWHLADLEAEGFGVRIRRLLGEERPFLADFDGARLAQERRYREKSLADGLTAFRAARQGNTGVPPAPAGPRRRGRGTGRRAGGCRRGDAVRRPAPDARARRVAPGGDRRLAREAMSAAEVQAATDADIPEVRRLFDEYVAWVGVDLSFQDFDRERAGLPGDY